MYQRAARSTVTSTKPKTALFESVCSFQREGPPIRTLAMLSPSSILAVSLLIVMVCLSLDCGDYCRLSVAAAGGGGRNVSYDHRALLVDGQRRVLISGSIHYPRSTPQMWPDLIAKAKEGGIDVIQTYVFWNGHEPERGVYNFEGRYDLVRFVKVAQRAGLYVNLRIGPYACAEWNYGGFPVWLHNIPGVAFRTHNPIFEEEMQRFTSKIVEMMKEEQLFYWQGGPIILAQIENEYGNVASSYGAAGKEYTKWAAAMALGLDTGVPWIMCQQQDAPDPVINTCNGFYCDTFTPNSNNKPKMWTETWSGWFQSFGGVRPYRPTEDVAFAVARFYQRGGTFQNYYMYHGGTNFGRTSGGPFISTSYDYDAPLDEYGNIRQPKWGHLKDLHQAIKLCEPAMIVQDPTRTSLGSMQEAHTYTNGRDVCAAFLANYDAQVDALVRYNGQSYKLPAWSVSILPDCKNVVFNSAQINAQTSVTTMKIVEAKHSRVAHRGRGLSDGVWQFYQEPIGASGSNSFSAKAFLEQISTTKDVSDYLWYSTSIEVGEEEISGGNITLSLHSLGHAVHVFVNTVLSGSGKGQKIQLEVPVTLNPGKNKIDLLSMTVGLQNYGAFFDKSGAGIDGPVLVKGLISGPQSLSSWTYQVGLQGEQLHLYAENEGTSSEWTATSQIPQNQPMLWYKTTFDSPAGNDPVALDLTSMGKGMAWVNGEGIGRYWQSYVSPQNGCSSPCSYKGGYSNSKCFTNCGQPSQSWYHVPRAWLKETGNTVVLFEESGGDPTKVAFVGSSASPVCAHVSESHPPPVASWGAGKSWVANKPEAMIDCGAGKLISAINFASYGTPQGQCGSFQMGDCHASSSLYTVRKACIGQRSCSLTVSNEKFKRDPCAKVVKSLAVEAVCSHDAVI